MLMENLEKYKKEVEIAKPEKANLVSKQLKLHSIV